MKVRYLTDHNTPLSWVPAGTVRDIPADDAKQLIDAGVCEAVKDPKPKAAKK